MIPVMILLALMPIAMVSYANIKCIPLNFGTAQIDLSSLLMVVVILFILLSGNYFRPTSTFPLLAYGFALAIIVATALFIFGKSSSDGGQMRNLSVGIVSALAYSVGVIYLLNGLLSSSNPHRLSATVVERQSTGARHVSYRLRLSSRDTGLGDGAWAVNYNDYWALGAGTTACIDLYDGFLGAKWYRAGMCPARSNQTIPWYYDAGPGSLVYNVATTS